LNGKKFTLLAGKILCSIQKQTNERLLNDKTITLSLLINAT